MKEQRKLKVSVKSTRSHMELYWIAENCDKTKEVILAQHICRIIQASTKVQGYALRPEGVKKAHL